MGGFAKVLIVDDEKLIRWSLREQLAEKGLAVVEAEDGLAGIEAAEREAPDLVFLDIRMPGADGLTVLRELRKRGLEAPVVMISAHATLEVAVEAMKMGATDFIKKPFQPEDVDVLVERLTRNVRLEREAGVYREREAQRYATHRIVGESRGSREARSLIGKIAGSAATNILIEGESGTGKGLAAKIIHHEGSRGGGPFIEVDCTSLPENLVESELFGHERGAFTDAKQSKKGLFELADGGTIFLDEIGDLPPAAQAKLLRVLEDRSFKRVGGVTDIRVDVRVVAATNRDLAAMVAAGGFRQDLYYRLTVLRVRLEPLRQRPEDIPVLCQHFIEQFNREFKRRYAGIAADALEALQGYPWPGNVRELRNCIERVMILEDKARIERSDLPPDVLRPPANVLGRLGRPAAASSHPTAASSHAPALVEPVASGESGRPRGRADETSGAPTTGLADLVPPGAMTIEDVEKTMILQALERTRFNQTKAARLLGLTRDTLRYRIKKHGLLED